MMINSNTVSETTKDVYDIFKDAQKYKFFGTCHSVLARKTGTFDTKIVPENTIVMLKVGKYHMMFTSDVNDNRSNGMVKPAVIKAVREFLMHPTQENEHILSTKGVLVVC